MNLTDLNVKGVFDKLDDLKNLNSAFGQPVKLDNITVVPVATVRINIQGEGSGSGGGSGAGSSANGMLSGAGGNGSGQGKGSGSGTIDIEVQPAGYIYEKDGQPTFVKFE